MTTKHFRMSYPAASGEMILQGHADACAEFGHATWVIDGVKQLRCPRCGENVATEAEAAEYAASLAAEAEEVRVKELVRNTLELTSSLVAKMNRDAWYVSHKLTGRVVRWPGESIPASWSNNRSAVLAGFDYARELSTESGDDYELITGAEVFEAWGRPRAELSEAVAWARVGERVYKNETTAHAARRAAIVHGHEVSLIAFDGGRNVYVFDVIA